MATTDYQKTINIKTKLNRDDGIIVMTSEDLPGLFLAGKNLLALARDLPPAIKALYRLNYEMDVEVELSGGMEESDENAFEWAGPLMYSLSKEQHCPS